MKYVTLCHEMIHAYMWSTLEDEGLIGFDSSGLPSITFGCEAHVPNPNAISVEDRFVEVICALQAAGNYNPQWTHELFNKNVFEIEDYRQALEDFLKNEYNWDSEPILLKNTLIQNFGTNWKQIVAGLISWKGLTETEGFEDWCLANGHTVTLNQEGFKTTPALGSIIGSFNFLGNKNCNL